MEARDHNCLMGKIVHAIINFLISVSKKEINVLFSLKKV